MFETTSVLDVLHSCSADNTADTWCIHLGLVLDRPHRPMWVMCCVLDFAFGANSGPGDADILSCLIVHGFMLGKVWHGILHEVMWT